MALIGALNTAIGGNIIDPDEYNANMDAIRNAFNDSAVLMDVNRTIVATHTFNPTVAGAPFTLGANATGQLVTGLNADQLDSQEGSFYRDAGNLNAGVLLDARVQASNVTQHQAALSVAFTQLTGSIAAAQVPAAAVTQHEAALSIAFTQLTGSIANAQVPAAAVTQHQAALSIGASQVTAGSLGVGNFTVTGDLTVTGDVIDGVGTTFISALRVDATALNFGTVSPDSTGSTTVTVTGAVVGDRVIVSAISQTGVPLNDASLAGSRVTSANTVTVVVRNNDDTNSRDWSNVDATVLVLQI